LTRVSDQVLCAEGATRLACVDERQTLRRIGGEISEVLSRPEVA
jgi:hypothetical protein